MDSSQPPNRPLNRAVADCLDDYFRALNGHPPHDLYNAILNEVEPPLLSAVLRYCDGNQSRAADVLGINRATLRKKLGQHGICVNEARTR